MKPSEETFVGGFFLFRSGRVSNVPKNDDNYVYAKNPANKAAHTFLTCQSTAQETAHSSDICAKHRPQMSFSKQ